MEILKIEDLSFSYPLTENKALSHIDLTVNEGEFTVIAGATGSGKSTLLRLLKRELSPLGEKSGKIYCKGVPIEEMTAEDSAFRIGFVMQRPEQQIVTDKVWHELAFGLEGMGVPQELIARRVAEMSCYFGIEDQYERRTDELSGGQKQLLNLASVMAMDPDILILDEPTAQLDPITAADFLATLKKLNTDLSLTVIIVEHRLEELIPLCDRLIVLDKGKVIENGTPRNVARSLSNNEELLCSLPSATRLYHALGANGECPLTSKEGRRFITESYPNKIKSLPTQARTHSDSLALELKGVYFRYERDAGDVLRGIDLEVFENEIFCILGGNGSGKSTALSVCAGIASPYSGQVKIFGKKIKEYKGGSLYRECLTLLPQDVQTVFLRNTVKEELDDAHVDENALPFDLSHLYEKHPYDLSGGEQQLLALAKALSTKPRLLLLDEPTKGLDAYKKQQIMNILKELKENGVTVVTVTHDVEFAAAIADRVAMFFRGDAVSVGTPEEFFFENSFYTTSASRMSKGYYDRAVTVEALSQLCRLNAEGASC